MCVIFLFFKKKTAYEMRISDWSSDVCSSNLSALNQNCSADNKGLSMNVSQRELETTPQGNRSIDDIARLDPRINVTDQGDGSISMAGLPNRFNNISVDGISQGDPFGLNANGLRSEEHTSELQSLMRTSYAVFCLKQKNTKKNRTHLQVQRTPTNNH